jgi:hypothetical protein
MRCAVCVLVTTPTARAPTVAVAETEIFATRLVADCTVVELTVIPAPKVARVEPATKAVFGEPVTRTLRLVAPRGAEVVSGREIAITSSDFPLLTSPVCLLRTLSAAVPIGKPFGTTTVSRRKPVVALNVVTAVAVTVTGAPDTGVNVTSLLDAVALKPVPVIEIATEEDAPMGFTPASVPARTTSTATARLRAAKIGTRERVGSKDSKGQYNQRGFFIATLR